MNDFVSTIREKMLERRMSMRKLALETHISPSSLSRKLSGKSELTIAEAVCICKFFGISLADFFD